MQRRWLGLGLAMAGIGACTADSSRSGEKTQASRAALVAETSAHVAWGEGPGQLGFRPAFRESIPMGAPAFAVASGGAVLVLDAVRGRVVRVRQGEVSQVAEVPVDCDDISAAPDGAFAVRRSMKPEVLVFSSRGEKIGSVDTSAVLDADAITLGASRRVFVTNGFQQTFLAGSPSMPQSKAAVRANAREGAYLLSDGSGVVGVKVGDEVEVRVVTQTGEDRTGSIPRSQTKARWSFGKADAIRVVGAAHGVACVRLEHVGAEASGALVVKREAACLELATGKTTFRRELASPGAYLPRRELAMSDDALTFIRATADGLDISTWPIAEGGVR